jgi:hypothetical protein
MFHDDNEPVTRRQWLTSQALLSIYRERGAVSWGDIFLIKEAVASTALEHPEWDMDEEKTTAEWMAQ